MRWQQLARILGVYIAPRVCSYDPNLIIVSRGDAEVEITLGWDGHHDRRLCVHLFFSEDHGAAPEAVTTKFALDLADCLRVAGRFLEGLE